MCAYLETWHLDIEDFLELRKNTGDERRRTHDMNTANWIPDLFMKRVREGGSGLSSARTMCPTCTIFMARHLRKDTPNMKQMADAGKIKLFKRMEALQLWRQNAEHAL